MDNLIDIGEFLHSVTVPKMLVALSDTFSLRRTANKVYSFKELNRITKFLIVGIFRLF